MTESRMNRISITGLLSLWERERMKVRDWRDLPVPPKLSQEHNRVLRESDDSKTGAWQFLAQSEISRGSGHVSHLPENHDPSHPIPRQAWRQDSRNPKRRDQADAAAGICSPRSFDFGDVAKEFSHNQSRSFGDNGRDSREHSLAFRDFREKKNRPLTSILSPISGERREDLRER